MKADQKFTYIQSSGPLRSSFKKMEKTEEKKEEKKKENEEEEAISSWENNFGSRITLSITKYS